MSADQKPILFLDVDGVINCLGTQLPHDRHEVILAPEGPAPTFKDGSSRLKVNFGDDHQDNMLNFGDGDFEAPSLRAVGVPVQVPHGLKQRIHSLMQHFDIVWCTAWFKGAHGAFQEILELPEQHWPSVNWGAMKLPAIFEWVKDGRPWAFIDDDMSFEERELTLAFPRQPHLLVEPDPAVGLTDEQVDQLIRWADALK